MHRGYALQGMWNKALGDVRHARFLSGAFDIEKPCSIARVVAESIRYIIYLIKRLLLRNFALGHMTDDACRWVGHIANKS